MHKQKISILLILILSTLVAISQNSVDSIKKILEVEKDPIKQAELMLELSNLLRNTDISQSTQIALNALDISKSENDKYLLSRASYVVGKAYLAQYAYSKALEYFQKSIQIKSRLIEANPNDKEVIKELALVYYNTGNALAAMGMLDSSLFYHHQSLQVNKSIDNKIEIAWSYYSLSETYNHRGDITNSGLYLDSAISIFQELNDLTGLGYSWNAFGNFYRDQGNYPMALQYYLQSKQINEDNRDLAGLATANNNIANVYKFQGDLHEALANYITSLDIRLKIGDIPGQTESYNNIGSIYFQLSKDSLKYLDSAAFYYAKCIEYSELINSYSLLATATNNLGGVYLYKNELDSALLYFNRAKDLSLFTGNMQIYAQALMSTGDLYNRQKKYKEALTTLDEAKLIAQLSDAQELVRDIAFMQSQAYYSLGDYKKAFSLLVEYQNVADRLKNEENTKKITKLNLRYEFEQKQKELEFQKKQSDLKAQAELKQQKLIRNVFVLAFGFVVLLAIVLYKNFKRKKRDNQILQIQKHEIEKQRDEIQKKNGFITIQNEKLVEQRDEIQSQKQSIIDSINYASRIQKAVLPPENGLVTFFDDSFIYYKPRDIVSGDFFWYRHTHNRFILVAADCTGHGVPAGFMSMLGVSLLNQIIGQNPNLHANEILNQLRAMVISSLHQEGTLVETKDGMDLSLLIFDKELKNMEFAAANNPLFLIRNKEILIYKADKMPIGVSFRREYDFALHNIDLQKGDKCYIFSDGYVDQFGGDRNGKFLVKRFRELLVEINYLDMSAQRERLHAEFLNWKGENEQVDDILIIGVSV